MDGDKPSETQPKRYNTRPKSKNTLESLNEKYSGYVVETSPKTRKPRNSRSSNDPNYQNYTKSRQAPYGYKTNKQAQAYNYQNVQPHQYYGDPAALQARMYGQNLTNVYQTNLPPNLPGQPPLMYNNPPQTLPPNYPAHFRPDLMAGGYGNVRSMNQMVHTSDSFRFAPNNQMYNPNTQVPMASVRPSPQQTPHPYPGMVGVQGQNLPYGYPNLAPGMPVSKGPQFPSPTNRNDSSLPPPSMVDGSTMGYPPQMPQQKPKSKQPPGSSPMMASPPKPRGRPPEQFQNYFNAVDVILKDLSETSKFEPQLDNFKGRVTLLDTFDFPELHKTVSFDYLINSELYKDIVSYFKGVDSSDLEFPFNSNQTAHLIGVVRPVSEIAKYVAIDKTDKRRTPKPQPVKTEGQVNLENMTNEMSNYMIHVSVEKKVYPITFESCKDLTFEELKPLFTTLTKGDCKMVKKKEVQKFWVKSVLNSSDQSNNHYLISHSQDGPANYSLKYQFGCFYGNNFFNKRVPLFTSADFGENDPSFLFAKSLNPKKTSRVSFHYVKVSRFFEVFSPKLDLFLTFEVSKILREGETDLRNTTYQLTLHCSLSSLPMVLNLIHFRN